LLVANQSELCGTERRAKVVIEEIKDTRIDPAFGEVRQAMQAMLGIVPNSDLLEGCW
jgi:hypothetical protein